MLASDCRGIVFVGDEQGKLLFIANEDGCYSQEMVDKLNEIVEKYDLKLLSEYVGFNWWESRALLDSLSIDSLFYDDLIMRFDR